MENKDLESKFHESRIAFMVIDGEIIFLQNSKMSHIEWYTSLGLSVENFDNIVRGCTLNGRIVFYKGDFIFDDEVIETAKKYAPKVQEFILNPNAEVWVGVIKGKVGEVWNPRLRII